MGGSNETGEKCDKVIHVALPSALKQKIVDRSLARNRTVSQWIRLVLRQKIAELEGQVVR